MWKITTPGCNGDAQNAYRNLSVAGVMKIESRPLHWPQYIQKAGVEAIAFQTITTTPLNSFSLHIRHSLQTTGISGE
jgi:hypothetical protein